jgi:hypothetical protein
MFSENPSLSNHEARCIIENTADDLAASSHEVGEGRVDAHGAVHAATDPSSVDC